MRTLIVIIVATTLSGIATAQTCPPGAQCLFRSASGDPAAAMGGALNDPTVKRSRSVLVDRDLLNGQPASGIVTLNLFEDVALTAMRQRFERRGPESSTWIGSIVGDPNLPPALSRGSVIIVDERGSIAANISVNGSFYQIRQTSAGIHTIREIDQSGFPPEAHSTLAYLPPEQLSGDAVGDTGGTIDVVVVYTSAAVAGAGSQSAISAQVRLGIDETNEAYQNTGVTQRVHLAYEGLVSYTETGDTGIDLGRLAAYGDGYLDEVRGLRQTYRADIVSLWVESAADACGRGYQMTSLSTNFGPSAYNVVRRNCATGNYSFGHEMGHNMGADHNRADASGGLYSFSYGYQEPSGLFRSIMAYPCPTGACPRLQGFSNPASNVNGQPFGMIDTDPNAADNAHTLNLSAATVASFINSTGPLPPLAGIGFTPFIIVAGQTVQFTDNSSGSPTSWSWHFGDGANSSSQNPTHVFTSPGTYLVGLYAFGVGGWSDLTVTSVTVAPASGSVPNLTPYKPGTWSAPIVVSTTTGTNTDSGSFLSSDTLYVDWAVLNGGAATTQRFYTELYLDGILRYTWFSDPPLNTNFYANIADYSLGFLSVGNHTLRIKTDSTSVIAESNESDNEYIKTIAVTGVGAQCSPNATTLCLSNGRFSVRATWQTASGGGQGTAVQLSSDTGYFWFFSSTNLEMVAKILDACGLNGRKWVFAGGLTNVNVVMTITDTQTGAVRIYVNPQNTAFLPIQDTNAFSTCP